ncbi:zinc uptake transcriptional repressor Zur [Rheinheimera salexigens]|uniref:Ferric uptake regulation protein n=1 Tax=Rheinheimera salexigens TaxID=1628148 RepID=A0A1E7Q9J4_9GAMM|nr:zinc uptake transcriptional repressor Zur [Rheinheimera salexigens]OEY70733.1 transcriptional repressor [Rheinheimera salexigens]
MHTESLVSRARTVCQNNGARFTSIREKVFRLLAKIDGGIGAYELLEQLKQTEPAAKPATVYRALEFLTEQGFIHKIESSNAFLLCHHFDEHHPAQLLVCDKCGNVHELHSDVLQQEFDQQAQALGFTISHQTIEAHGICNKCSSEE